MNERARLIGVLLTGLAAAGCTNYYRVTDTASGKAYYMSTSSTSGIYAGGPVKFTDAATGRAVTLDQAKAEPISREEFDRAVQSAR